MTRKKLLLLLPLFFLLLTGASFQFGGIKHDLAAFTTSISTVILTSASTQVQVGTGSTAQVVKLPVATTLRKGWWYTFINESSQTMTISDTSSTQLTTIAAATSKTVYLKDASTSDGTWSLDPGAGSGGGGGSASIFVGQISWPGTASCLWDVNSSSLTAYAADTDCAAASVVGTDVEAPATKVPGIKILSAEVDTTSYYKFTATGRFVTNSGDNCAWAFSDGTAFSANIGTLAGNTTNPGTVTMVGYLKFGSTGDKTVQLYAENTAAGAECRIRNDDVNTSTLTISVEKLGATF